jgi:hypothetical protein
MAPAVARWEEKKQAPDKKGRRQARKTLAGAVDKRSLRATGRTAQFNFRCKAEVKARAFKLQELLGFETIAEFMEAAIEKMERQS